MPNPSSELTLDELKTIVHGLKMSSFGSLEDSASDEIRGMIKSLPSPETLDSLINTPGAIKHLKRDIGGIMRLIEIYSKRDMEYKTRYKSRTGLPPRYKVMDWRKAMKTSSNTGFIKGLIKTSASIDNLGYGDISGKFLKCAKDAMSNKFSEVEFIKVAADTFDKIGFKDDADNIRKIAQTYVMGTEDISSGIKNFYDAINNISNIIDKRSKNLASSPKAKNLVSLLGNLKSSLNNLIGNIKSPVQQIFKALPQIEEATQSAIPTHVRDNVSNKRLPIQWTEPDATGEQFAFVTRQDGKMYEVQRDEQSGELIIDDKVMAGADATTKPAAAKPADKTPETSGSVVGNGGITISESLSEIRDVNTVDTILNYLSKLASINNKIYKVAVTVALPPKIKWYIDDMKKKGDNKALEDLKNLLTKKREELAKTSPAPAIDPASRLAKLNEKQLNDILIQNSVDKLDNVKEHSDEKIKWDTSDKNSMIKLVIENVSKKNLDAILKTLNAFNLYKYLKTAKKSV